MKTISPQELRSRLDHALRLVQSGESFRVVIDGRAVADLVPVDRGRQTFVARERVLAILREAPLDRGFKRDLERSTGEKIQ